MFRKKETVNFYEEDTKRLLQYMDRVFEGDFTPLDLTEFHNPEFAEKYNHLLQYVLESNNAYVMRLNASMRKIGDNSVIKEMLEQVNSQTVAINGMRSSSQDLGDSIQNIQSSAQNILDSSHSVMNTSTNCTESMNSSIRIVDECSRQISDINTQVLAFKEKAEQINKIIDIVMELAQNSSLLALNASIEAARAGEAGKGFAVVAQQVGELSSNTTSCAEDIVKYVGELMTGITSLSASVEQTTKQLQDGNSSVHKSVKNMEVMNNQLNAINKEIDSIYSEINNQFTLTKSFISDIETMTDSYKTLGEDCSTTGTHMYRISRDIDNARSDMARHNSKLTTLDWITVFEIDHLIFTWRVYSNIAEFEHLRIEQLNNPKGCKLGKWIAAQTDPRIAGSKELQELAKAHEEVHQHACDSWYAKEDHDDEAALHHFQLTHEAYGRFVECINALREVIKSTGDTDETPIKNIW
ncbi:MAG: methyl-accepting chemotaxis protein [Bacteroidales bacterium]|nr:methyl-accepting chemotaxis protein [Lachnoclostridium sp.]MCM1384840.1 methyl-accepting chemotaxis protein [Lachnoclostridium sp.]MCM1465811.1 methyl-accepting chemotaxis protein [Bacteroidales bacterium]